METLVTETSRCKDRCSLSMFLGDWATELSSVSRSNRKPNQIETLRPSWAGERIQEALTIQSWFLFYGSGEIGLKKTLIVYR